MSGTTIPLFTKRKFNFNSATGTPSVVVIRSLDVSGWTEGVLNVRVHENNLSSTQTINVKAYPISNTSEEPSVDYRDDTAANVTDVEVENSTTDPAPKLLRASLAGDFGGAVQIVVEGASSATDATLSAELVLKD